MVIPARRAALGLALALAAGLNAQELELKAGLTGFDPGTSEGVNIPTGTSPFGLLWYPAGRFSMEQTITSRLGFSTALETDPVLMHRFQVQALIHGDYLSLRVGPSLWLLNPPGGGDFSLKPGLAMSVEGDFSDLIFASLRADLGLDSAALNSAKDAVYAVEAGGGYRLGEFIIQGAFSWNTLSQAPQTDVASRTERLRWTAALDWRRKAFPLALRVTAGAESIDWEWRIGSGSPYSSYHMDAIVAGLRVTWRVWSSLRVLAEAESTVYAWARADGLEHMPTIFTVMAGVVWNLEKPWEARSTW